MHIVDGRFPEVQGDAPRKIVVLGANGTMGFGAGALFSTVSDEIVFLARTKEKADSGIDAAVKMVRSNTVRAKVSSGSYDDDFERTVGEADLIFEAVTENLELKHQFFERVDACRRPDSIVATVTSGLSIAELARPRSDSFRQNFLGLHLFNPPNVIVGTELVAGPDTAPELMDRIEAWCVAKLGRVIVRTADMPGFAGNRIGFKVLNQAAQLAEEHGPLLVDRLLGPYTGRALSPLATVDLVGWDIHRAIVDNIYALTEDEAHATLKLPDYMAELIAKGTLGNKSGGGFFRVEDKRRFVLDPKSQDYRPVDEVALPALGFIDEIVKLHRVGLYREAMQAFAKADGELAQVARDLVAGYIAYSLERVGEVTQSLEAIDLIMGFGFNWAPPGLLVDQLGESVALKMIESAGLAVPAALSRAVNGGDALFSYSKVDPGRFFVAA